jgi:hypothetical protein
MGFQKYYMWEKIRKVNTHGEGKREGGGKQGQMTQTLYAHISKRKS